MESPNHPICPRQHARWNCQADLLGGFQIDDKLKLSRLLHWKIGWLGALQYFIHIHGYTTIRVNWVRSVRHKTANLDGLTASIHRRKAILNREVHDFCSVSIGDSISLHVKRAGMLSLNCCQRRSKIIECVNFERLKCDSQRPGSGFHLFQPGYVACVSRI